MPATVGSTSPLANSSRRKDAARKTSAEAGRRQIGAVLSGAAAVLSSGAAALYPCRAVGPASDSSYTACRTQAAHGGSVSVPYEDIPREPPCESTAREAVALQLSAARRDWIDNHLELGLEVNMSEPVLVTQGSALPAVAARQAAHADAGQCRNR